MYYVTVKLKENRENKYIVIIRYIIKMYFEYEYYFVFLQEQHYKSNVKIMTLIIKNNILYAICFVYNSLFCD